MPAEKKVSIHVLRGAAKRSSSALATTASTCQIPGGTSLLVGCVLGKNLTVTHQQAQSCLEQRPSDEREDTELLLGLEVLNGKGRTGVSTVPRSMSINSPSSTNPNLLPISGKFSAANTTFLFDKVEHFPPLSKPGGVWMTLIDDAGKEWSFEFCFWYSKESRIYYLKRFYPYVQATNLRGGDTVYFSRLEPEGTLLMGVRKQKLASPKHGRAIKPKNELEAKVLSSRDLKVSSEEGKSLLDDGALLEDHPATPSTDDASVDYDLCKSTDKKKMMRLTSPPPISFDTQSVDHIATGEAVATRKRRSITPESSEQINMKPGSQSSRGKRLGLTMEDYYEWEDIQDLFRAPPGAIATYTCVEGHEIEEYKEPPVLIKKTFYSAEIQEDDQWVQCDDCGCWRRLPADAFVHARWVCSDNEWDSRRARCNAPQELSDHEMDRLLEGLSEADFAGSETVSKLESYDSDSGIPPFIPSEEEDSYCKQPQTWNEAYGQMQKKASQLVLNKKCKSVTSGKELSNGGEDLLRSTDLINLSSRSPASMFGYETPHPSTKAGKGHQMCTGCSKPIGSAAQGCKRCGTLTEYGIRSRAQFSAGYRQ
uniref:CW-type domain-containing protein n=1 Tax=Physcomitrium patens TaxID=3218 RepID=A0A7I4DAG6_PHYPA